MIHSNNLDAYFHLMEKYPKLFTPSDIYPIVTDKKVIEEFITTTNKPVGIVYQSNYHLLVVDLIQNVDGGYYTYERVLHTKTGKGVVCIPEYQNKYILLKQYRHPIREMQICFPRGFGENGLTAIQNSAKELYEEIGAQTESIELLGEITPDSGFVASFVDITLCEVTSFNQDSHEEGVKEILLCTYNEIEEMIKSGQITDSFTICAFSLMKKSQ